MSGRVEWNGKALFGVMADLRGKEAGAHKPACPISAGAPRRPDPRPGRRRARLSLLLPALGLLLGALSPFRRSSHSAPLASGSGMLAKPVYWLWARAIGRPLRADSGRDFPSKEQCVARRLAGPVCLVGLLFAAMCLIAPTPAIAESGTSTTPLTMSVSNGSAREGQAVGFVVTLSGHFPEPVWQPVEVEYATSNGTATSGTDFRATSGTLAFSAGRHTQIVAVPTIHDTAQEGDETFTLTLSSSAHPTLGSVTGTGRIINNDDPVAAQTPG